MKPLLPLFLMCFVVIAAQAQTEPTEPQKFKANADYLQQLRNKIAVMPYNKDTLVNLKNGQFFLKDAKPGVYRLPKDGMPCIVPNTKDIAAIPNVFKGKITVPFTGNPPRIPNAIQPQLLDLLGKK